MAVRKEAKEDCTKGYIFGDSGLLDFERCWLGAAGVPAGYSGVPAAVLRELYPDVVLLGPNYGLIYEAASIIHKAAAHGRDSEAALDAIFYSTIEDERFIGLQEAYSNDFRNSNGDLPDWNFREAIYRIRISLQKLSVWAWQSKVHLRDTPTRLPENWVLVVFFFGLIGEGILQSNPIVDDKRRKAEPLFREVLESINAICN